MPSQNYEVTCGYEFSTENSQAAQVAAQTVYRSSNIGQQLMKKPDQRNERYRGIPHKQHIYSNKTGAPVKKEQPRWIKYEDTHQVKENFGFVDY